MTAPAAIDVLVPVYNAAATLDESFASLAAQSFTDFRVIAIDDGSTDDSARVLAQWAARDPRFTFVSTPNGGIVSALNAALKRATAPIIARLDADDLCDPERFERQHHYLSQHPRAVAVGGRVSHIDEHGTDVDGMPHPGDPGAADPWAIPALEPYIVHPFLMARSEAMRAAGGYRHVPHSEDSDLYWRLRDHGTLHNLDERVGWYRLHSGSISGASVVNGRVMAVGSQLGAWAARQRERGLADPGFGADLIGRLAAAQTLNAMCDQVADIVGDAELPRFRLACGIKLLELSGYRPYEIDAGDARFVRRAFRNGTDLARSKGNLATICWQITQTAARLLRAGKPWVATSLLTPALWPTALAKAVLRKDGTATASGGNRLEAR